MTHRRPGRRAAFLALFGVVYAAIGVGIFTVPPTDTQRRGLALIVDPVPYTWYGSLWLAAALVAVGAALAGPPGDRYGFYALMVPAAAWAGAYAGQMLLGFAPGVLGLLVYGALAMAVAIVAGWPDVDRTAGRRG